MAPRGPRWQASCHDCVILETAACDRDISAAGHQAGPMIDTAASFAAADSPQAETHGFDADVGRLLQLMAHSVYADRDVFLRELVSNGADACEKLRLAALTDPVLLAEGGERLAVAITADAGARTLTVSDTGIGMNRADLVENLGVIARSGTRRFLDGLEAGGGGANLIGRFGIGFYASFMVATEVVVDTRKAGEAQAWRWRSTGEGRFSVEPLALGDAPARGTTVVVHLKDDAGRYLEPWVIEGIVEKHSRHLAVPILLRETADAEPRELSDGVALWTRPKAEVTPEASTEFYRALTGRIDAPLLALHAKVEGRHSFAALAFVPGGEAGDLFDPARRARLKLYVRRVFITEDAPLLPGWLRFVVGVLDSEDLPLNVSRETLQSSPAVEQIRAALTGRIVSELKKLAEGDREKYEQLWEAFGPVLKEGLYEDPARRDDLFALARFRTTKNDGWRSLTEIAAGLRPNQTAVYYLAGDDAGRLLASPHLEGFRARGVEVLLLPDAVDSFWVSAAVGFDGKPFRSVTQGAADIGLIPLLEETPDAGDAGAEIAPVLAYLKQTLGAAVADVRASDRLSQSPVCLVADTFGPDRRLAQILAAHGRLPEEPPPVLEVNPRHAAVAAIAHRLAGGAPDEVLADTAWLLFDAAQVLDGRLPTDPGGFGQRLSRLLERTAPAA